MKEIFIVGHFSIYFFGITIALGILTGLWIMMREGKRKGLDNNKLLDLGTYSIMASLIGARLYYVIAFNFDYYLKNPKAVFFVREGGLSIQGGLIGGILFALWYTKKNNISFWRAADAFAPGIIIGQAIGRIGCDVFGIPMKSIYPWGIKINGQILHPAQLYELFLDLILFTYLWRKRDKITYNGQLFIEYIIGFSLIRGIVEFFRSNPIVVEPFTIAHITSLIIIIVAIFISRIIKNKEQIDEKYVSNNTVTVSNGEYLFTLIIGIVGAGIYYYIH
ncbi:prolipoprotein diacylglyceryl transferase [Anaeromicrobium sediminis]|uniref:prolipoprotein diacylglyceryl transferase n=1 Tax=Anaeromicrobium sediminis TaxID=1478221 RepID=UPI001FA83988|nr:prolipoprotein diacylglyceryl transferase [Anaeromicrobium sediminis]